MVPAKDPPTIKLILLWGWRERGERCRIILRVRMNVDLLIVYLFDPFE